MSEVDFDVAIIGGGPAGSAMGAYLARAGVRCAVFEGACFPRPHVGESLVPASTRVFRELGFLDEMERQGFVHKYGATWTSPGARTRPYDVDWSELGDENNAAIRFDERPQSGVPQSYTYHVDRARFDSALLKHAEAAGAKVHQGLRVLGVDFEGEHPELRIKLGRSERRVSARIVCDASGRKTLLGRQLGLKRTDPSFDQYAVHTWVEGYDRASGPNPDHIHIHFLPDRSTWVWQIPITESVTSLGVVTDKARFKAAGTDREAFFEAQLRSRADLGARYDASERIRPLTEEADYSYAMTRFSGDRFLLLGDAARFVDPIFSSGVSIALHSARLGSGDVLEALESGRLGAQSYRRFETTMRRGVKNWYDFICLYYRLNVLFTYFIEHPRYRLDVLKLLQGDVYDEDQPAVLEAMRQKVAQVEQNPDHMWHHLLDEDVAARLRHAAPES